MQEAKAHLLERGEELDPARSRAAGAHARGGGEGRVEAPRAQPRRRCAAARRREPRGGDDGDRDRAPVRRHEGPDHRPRRSQHPRARAPDGRRLHHRRHAARGRPLVVRRAAPRDRAPDADEADRGRAHPSGADRGDVLPVEGGARGDGPPGWGAGRLRGELRPVPRGAREDPRRLRFRTSYGQNVLQAHARGRAPGGDHGDRAGRERARRRSAPRCCTTSARR